MTSRSDRPLTLRQATTADLDQIESLLRAEDLPHEDIHEDPKRFVIASDDEGFVGIGGLELYGSVGLLRSVVIEPSRRGRGFGTTLCHRLERNAADTGVETLYLLTTTVPAFFDRRGYDRIDRDDPPLPIQQTVEFRHLCPQDAVCLRKRLPDE